MTAENTLYLDKHIFLCLMEETLEFNVEEINYLKENFCGIVVDNFTKLNELNRSNDTLIYIFGNIKTIISEIHHKNRRHNIIKELSWNYDDIENIDIITLGEVPINVHNVGLFFRNFFIHEDYFERIHKAHHFQVLTESNKPGISYRKGIYISKVVEENDIVSFNLLRCSTNLDGPTDNFREVDEEIVGKVNNLVQYFFEQKTDLNHILAQVYNNNKINGKERKAKIKDHSDKTKDMPRNGLIAFCTFYQFSNENKGDINTLTRLRFRLKGNNPKLTKMFDVILYPNSVFIISLSINRLYTHEIVPSYLSIDKLPTRLGYVIRCSKTRAIFRNNRTYVEDHNEFIEFEESSDEGVKELKSLYFKENTSSEMINYGKVNFSLNRGDYIKPLI